MKMRRLFLLTVSFILGTGIVWAIQNNARPWTFWYWMYGKVSPEGIRADLKMMKDAGLGGTYLMPIRGIDNKPEYGGKALQLTDEFWRMTDCAMSVADSLGLQLGIHICDGFALAGGPWITPQESMQKVVFSDTIVSGGRKTVTLPRPKSYNGYYRDIATYAIPVVGNDLPEPAVTWSEDVTRDEKGTFRASKPCHIDYAFATPVTVRSIDIVPGGNNIQSQRLLLEVSDDGKAYRRVKQMTPPRQGWQNTGFDFTYSIPPTTARYYRFSWSPEGSEPGSEDLDAAKWKANLKISKITLSSSPRISQWEGKAGFVWRVASRTTSEEIPVADCAQLKDIKTIALDGDKATLNLPKGRWRILRIGHTSTGHTNATGGSAKGLECDKFSQAAVNKQVDNWFALFTKRPHSHVVKYMHVDSWECGSQNWSENFASEFQKRRGYDLMPYLPLLAGYPIESAERSEQVLRDVRQTIDDLLHEVFFATIKERASQFGCLFSSESVAPTMMSDGLRHYRYADLPMGEYWLNSPTHDKPNDMLDAVSGAHIYGKNIVQAEGFTELRGVWNETPAMIKPLLDRNLALGMNKLFFHVTAHNPWTDRKPGMTLDGIGLFFQREQIWMPEARAFTDYVTRCQKLLQQGRPVVDIAVYTGEELPSRSITPDRLVPMLPGLFGEARVESERARLANVGQPMEESPVGVRHSSGIIDLKDWVNPLHGYSYDSFNKDVLLTATASNGKMRLEGGMEYGVVVLPQARPMNPDNLPLSEEAQKAVERLKAAGVKVVDKPLADADLSLFGIERDAVLPEGVAYCHRRIDAENADVYFLANQQDTERTISIALRTTQSEPLIYDAVTQQLTVADTSYVQGNHTHLTVRVPANGSRFVLFGFDSLPAQVEPLFTFAEVQFSNPWTILFNENGKRLTTPDLIDWTSSDNDSIRYYSGTATYTNTFKYKGKPGNAVRLRLTGLHDVAHVWVNGTDCGIVWTAPYELDVTRALRKGKNEIRIDVTNTWANALRGADKGTPPFSGIWTDGKYRMPGDTLLPAGLTGNVLLSQ